MDEIMGLLSRSRASHRCLRSCSRSGSANAGERNSNGRVTRREQRRYVLDANALIGFFEGRAGVSEKVRHLMGDALRQDLPLLMSAVNWGEVFYIAWRRHGEATAREVEASLRRCRSPSSAWIGNEPRGLAP